MTKPSLKIVHIVAMDRNRCIGNNNTLPFHVPIDLQHFKQLTQGNAILMGRKTFESIGKALPNRHNYVLTHDQSWENVHVTSVHNIEQALTLIQEQGFERVYIIGGSQLYAQTQHIADCLEVTHIELDVVGDSYYPVILPQFQKVTSKTVKDPITDVICTFATYLKTSQ